jgi:hypothetical protein
MFAQSASREVDIDFRLQLTLEARQLYIEECSAIKHAELLRHTHNIKQAELLRHTEGSRVNVANVEPTSSHHRLFQY